MTQKMHVELSASRILVTGARGFIGSHLCSRLVKNNNSVYAITRSDQGSPDDSVTWLQGDLSDQSFVKTTVREIRPDYIFHLSGFVSGLRELNIVLESYHSLLTSTVNILAAATEFGCKKIILAGSLEEPDYNDIIPVPSSPYAAAKWASRGYAAMFYKLYGTPIANPRIFMVYGPGQRELKKLIPYVITTILKNESLKLSSGTRAIDWVFIDDVIDGLINIAQSSVTAEDIIDIGTGNTITVKELVRNIVSITGSTVIPEFGEIADRPLERVAVADPAATYRKTGWKPKVTIDEGLTKTVEWYKTRFNGLTNQIR
jgi:UDP-glucose 4-epimerase